MTDALLAAIPIALVIATPLLLAVAGELLAQRSGVINLGIEGLMLSAALAATVAAQATGSTLAGVAGGIAASVAVAAVFAVSVLATRADQIVAGTAINLLAVGGTSVIYRELQMRGSGPLPRPPFDWVTPLSWLVVPALIAAFLWYSRPGLRVRACGENPDAVTAAGLRVWHYRALALGIEAVLTGLAGAHIALWVSNGFAENVTAGRGFIALAVVIFARWRVAGVIAGTALFGTATAFQYALQASGSGVPFHLLLALPYVLTLVVILGIAGRVRAPESLGR